jgi:recombinational DNA repair protein RecT
MKMMTKLSTREAAEQLGINHDTLAHYIAVGKVKAPEIVKVGRRIVHLWTVEEVEAVRRLLPKIANGRKTRWQKLREKREQTAQARAPVPHRPRKVRSKKRK